MLRQWLLDNGYTLENVLFSQGEWYTKNDDNGLVLEVAFIENDTAYIAEYLDVDDQEVQEFNGLCFPNASQNEAYIIEILEFNNFGKQEEVVNE